MPAIAFERAKRSPSGTPAIPPPELSCEEKRLAFRTKACSWVHVSSSGTERTATPAAASSAVPLKTTAAAPASAASVSNRDACGVPPWTPTASTTAPGTIASRSVES